MFAVRTPIQEGWRMLLSQNSLRTRAVGLALAAVRCVTAAPAAAAPARVSAAIDAIHIDNFGRINDRYYRGAQPQGGDFKALAALGVKMVIDLASEGDAGEEAN